MSALCRVFFSCLMRSNSLHPPINYTLQFMIQLSLSPVVLPQCAPMIASNHYRNFAQYKMYNLPAETDPNNIEKVFDASIHASTNHSRSDRPQGTAVSTLEDSETSLDSRGASLAGLLVFQVIFDEWFNEGWFKPCMKQYYREYSVRS